MKIHILGRNALNCALYLEFNEILYFYNSLGQLGLFLTSLNPYTFLQS